MRYLFPFSWRHMDFYIDIELVASSFLNNLYPLFLLKLYLTLPKKMPVSTKLLVFLNSSRLILKSLTDTEFLTKDGNLFQKLITRSDKNY